MRGYYILEGTQPIPELDLLKWARWFENVDNRRVAKTFVTPDIEVSTVFLGFDHAIKDGPPMLFETLVFGGPLADEMERYSDWASAEQGHQQMVARVQATLR